MALHTATYSWALVPENADPAWPLFDRLVSQVDETLGAVKLQFRGDGVMTASMQTIGSMWFPTSDDRHVWRTLSLEPFGPLQRTVSANSGVNLQVDFYARYEAGLLSHLQCRAIVNPGSYNMSGDSAWVMKGFVTQPINQPAFTAIASRGPGTHRVTIEMMNIAASAPLSTRILKWHRQWVLVRTFPR
jgi:hypothetical protein